MKKIIIILLILAIVGVGGYFGYKYLINKGIVDDLFHLNNKKWDTANLTLISSDILIWNSDKDGDNYKVYLDDNELGSTGHEYYILDNLSIGNHNVYVESIFEEKIYKSNSLEFNITSLRETTISDISELETLLNLNNGNLGSLKNNALKLDFSEVENSSFSLINDLNISSSLDRLTIVSKPDLTLNNFKIEIAERTKPLTIVLHNCNMSVYDSYMFEYVGESDFQFNLINYGNNTYSNTKSGSNGSDGRSSSEIGAVEGEKGGNGGDGGGIFAIPNMYLFTEKDPSFITGDGGNGGDGGRGVGIMHGGDGGNGGNGGYVFNGSNVFCFNAQYKEYSGSYGEGGTGGKGSTEGITNGNKGKNGLDGGLYNSSSKLQYLSRTDGIMPGLSIEGQGSFDVSYLNEIIVWNKQENVTKYNILVDGIIYNSTNNNYLYLGDYREFIDKEIKIEAIIDDGNKILSNKLKFLVEDKYILTEPTINLTGHQYIEIDASLLENINELRIGADVLHVSIINKEETKKTYYLNISAPSRRNNLILDLNNIEIHGAINKPTISLNDGVGSNLASDPILLLNLKNSEIIGKRGQNGISGSEGSGLNEGEPGSDGENGNVAVFSSQLFIFGDNSTINGGDGGHGGDGGDAINNGGDGGNGGNGAEAIKCNNCYIILDDITSSINIYGGDGGFKGLRGDLIDPIFGSLNSARDGIDGKNAEKYIGSVEIIQGSYN